MRMKYITFKRESNDFADILTNSSLKTEIGTVITWANHLMIGVPKTGDAESLLSYIFLVFGDDVVSAIAEDFTPIPGVDYTPEKPNQD